MSLFGSRRVRLAVTAGAPGIAAEARSASVALSLRVSTATEPFSHGRRDGLGLGLGTVERVFGTVGLPHSFQRLLGCLLTSVQPRPWGGNGTEIFRMHNKLQCAAVVPQLLTKRCRLRICASATRVRKHANATCVRKRANSTYVRERACAARVRKRACATHVRKRASATWCENMITLPT